MNLLKIARAAGGFVALVALVVLVVCDAAGLYGVSLEAQHIAILAMAVGSLLEVEMLQNYANDS